MMRNISVLLVIGLASLPLGASAEEILYERTIGVNRSVNIFDTNQFDLDLTFGDHFFTPTNPVTLFDDLLVTPADEGNVYEVLAGDSTFDVVAQRLTDAENEFIRLIFSEHQQDGRADERGWRESKFFLGLATPSDPDLAGSTIERIRLSVDEFTLLPPSIGGVSASATGAPVNLRLTISFFGTPVPEPGGIWLLWSGLVAVLSGRRARCVLAQE